MLHVVSMAPWFYLLHRNETLVLHRCELGAWPGAGEDWISEPVLWTDSWIHLGLLISMTESDLCLGAKAVRIIVMLLDWFIYRYFCCVCVCLCQSFGRWHKGVVCVTCVLGHSSWVVWAGCFWFLRIPGDREGSRDLFHFGHLWVQKPQQKINQ